MMDVVGSRLDTVKVNGAVYVITDPGDGTLDETWVYGQTEPRVIVTALAYRQDDPARRKVEISWLVDHLDAEDGADLVDDWGTADFAVRLE